ncbi:uncharacterized protein PG998_004089 [Apiospora kogelbergensis]|uniref:uncharacterized protein n=1 Tax=Apiospora kogelbergensis TaxID=1337665 RepID=UPI003130700C
MRPESTQTRKLRDGWFPWPKLLLLLCDMDMGLKRSMDGADVKDVEALVLEGNVSVEFVGYIKQPGSLFFSPKCTLVSSLPPHITSTASPSTVNKKRYRPPRAPGQDKSSTYNRTHLGGAFVAEFPFGISRSNANLFPI